MLTNQIFRRLFFAGIAVFLFCNAEPLVAQTNVAINATGAVADPSAILDVSSTTGGVLVPRMTEAEKNGIASPTDGLIIYQTDNGAGFWYYDGTDLQWYVLPRYIGGDIDMGPAPSNIVQGSGYTITRLVTGTDEITYNQPYGGNPSVMLSNSEADGSAPLLSDYCIPEFDDCLCHSLSRLEVYGGPGTGTPIIINDVSGCTPNADAYEFYPPGHPVYQLSGNANLCSGATNIFSVTYRGNTATAPCGTNRVTVWVDWQQDGFFDDIIDRVVYTPPTNWSGGPVTSADIPIPAFAFSGDTFLRAMVSPEDATNSCPSGTDGETEEYQVYIACRPTPVYNDQPSYCNIGDATAAGFRVSCRKLGGDPIDIQSYYFQVNESD